MLCTHHIYEQNGENFTKVQRRFARPDFDGAKCLFENKCIARLMVDVFFRDAANARLSLQANDESITYYYLHHGEHLHASVNNTG